MITGPASHSFISQRLRLRYVDWGNPSAPPLILLHGGRDHSRSWDWTAQELRRDWHVIAPDLRGHGDSDWSPSGDYGGMANLYDLAQLIHQLKLAPVTIVAHSYGGNIALRYAGVYPANVKKLVAIEGLGPSPKMLAERLAKPIDARLRDWIDAKRGVAARTPRRYATLDDAFKRMKEENDHLSDEQARHLTIHGVSQNEDGSYSWKFDPYMRVFPPFDIAQDRRRKRYGRRSPARRSCSTAPTAGPRTRRRTAAPNTSSTARVVTIKNARHWLHHDQFDKFMAELRAFL